MVLYLGLLVIYTLLAFAHGRVKVKGRKKNGKVYCFFLVLPLFITVAFRDISVGNDTYSYAQYFYYYVRSNATDLLRTSKEVGFALFNHYLGQIGIDYRGLIIIVALITYLLFFRYLIRHTSNYALSILVFICILGYFRTMNIMREMLAVMIVLNGVDFLEKGKKKSFAALVLCATLIHRMSIVGLGLLAYNSFSKIGNLKKYIIVFGAAIAYMSLDKVLLLIINVTGHYGYLYDSTYTNENGYLAMVAMLLFTISFIVLEKKNTQRLIDNKMDTSRSDIIAFGYNLLFALCVVGFGFGLADRAGLVFSMFFIETISNKQTGKQAITKSAPTICIVAVLLVYFLMVMILRNNWQGTVPYVFSIR